jgi:hypothetical protein
VPEDVLRYRIEIDQNSLQSELSQLRTTVGATLSDAVEGLPGMFNSAQFDIEHAAGYLQTQNMVAPAALAMNDVNMMRGMLPPGLSSLNLPYAQPETRFGAFDVFRSEAAGFLRGVPLIGPGAAGLIQPGPGGRMLMADYEAALKTAGWDGNRVAQEATVFVGEELFGAAMGKMFIGGPYGGTIGAIGAGLLGLGDPIRKRFQMKRTSAQLMRQIRQSNAAPVGIATDQLAEQLTNQFMADPLLEVEALPQSLALLAEQGQLQNVRTQSQFEDRVSRTGENLILTQRMMGLDDVNQAVPYVAAAMRIAGTAGQTRRVLGQVMGIGDALMIGRDAAFNMALQTEQSALAFGIDPNAAFNALGAMSEHVRGMGGGLTRDIRRFRGMEQTVQDVQTMAMQATRSPLMQAARMAFFDQSTGTINEGMMQQWSSQFAAGERSVFELGAMALGNVATPADAFAARAAAVTTRTGAGGMRSGLNMIMGRARMTADIFGADVKDVLLTQIADLVPDAENKEAIIAAASIVADPGAHGTPKFAQAMKKLDEELVKAQQDPTNVAMADLSEKLNTLTDSIGNLAEGLVPALTLFTEMAQAYLVPALDKFTKGVGVIAGLFGYKGDNTGSGKAVSGINKDLEMAEETVRRKEDEAEMDDFKAGRNGELLTETLREIDANQRATTQELNNLKSAPVTPR